ncbi:MAG: hypothetical protein HY720_14160 [Planctomycetes bacterium]|nr:hypothetical protein [Planctomycetota bacterium]
MMYEKLHGGKRAAVAALLALALFAGCKPPAPPPDAPQGPATGEPEPALVLALDGSGGFFDLPWPSDARRAAGRPDLSRFPNPGRKKFVDRIRDLAMAETDGASPTGTIYFQFDRPVSGVPDDPMYVLRAESPIFVVDVDPASPSRGRRHPCHVRVTRSADRFRPAHLLQILPVPGLGLEEGRLYAAVVLRRLGHPGGPLLGQNRLLGEMLAGRPPAVPGGAAWTASLAPLVASLPSLGIRADEIAAATVWRTGRPSDRLFGAVRAVDALPALAPSGTLRVRGDYPSYRALLGDWAPPQYQEGVAPFVFGGGKMRTDSAGRPVKVSDGWAPFALAIPAGKMPARGFPLYFYIHGTGGASTQVLDRGVTTTLGVPPPPGTGPAMLAAGKGWASSSTGLPLAPERLGLLSADGYIPYNFFNPVAMRDNFFQMILELAQFRKMVLALAIEPSLCPGTDASASADGKIRFDPAHVVVSGQSLGSYLAGMLAATLGGFEGAVLTGAGGSWVEFAFGPKDPVDLQLLLENLLVPNERVPLDRWHPIVMAFDLAVGPSDNTHFVPYLLRNPRVGPPPHLLVVEGYDDHQVPTGLQRALVLASGADMAGADPGPSAADQIAPVLPWGAQAVLPFPVRGNRLSPGVGPRTAVMVRHAADPVTNEGHFVVYQIESARNQVAGFLGTLLRDGIPTVGSGTR